MVPWCCMSICIYVCASSVKLVHTAKAAGWNEMPFGRDTHAITSNTLLDSGPPWEGEIWGLEPPVPSTATYYQITFALLITFSLQLTEINILQNRKCVRIVNSCIHYTHEKYRQQLSTLITVRGLSVSLSVCLLNITTYCEKYDILLQNSPERCQNITQNPRTSPYMLFWWKI